MISVCVVTYNHAPYIRQCLTSVMQQQVNAPLEVLIGDDGSTDGTYEICQEFALRYPDTIKLFRNNRENVIYIEGKPTGRRNVLNLLQAASGKYIALVEGDDYWLGIEKLQKQFALMEAHPNASVCFHNSVVRNETTNQEKLFHPQEFPAVTSTRELLEKNFIPTASAFFKKQNWYANPPAWYLSFRAGDWGMHLLHASYGELHYINETHSVYRHNPGSGWQSQARIAQLKQVIAMYETLEKQTMFQSWLDRLLKAKKELETEVQTLETEAKQQNSSNFGIFKRLKRFLSPRK